MANYGTKPTDPQQNGKKRWELLLDQPEHSAIWDLSTGKTYRRGMLKAVHKDGFESVVDYFQVIGTDEMLYVPFLRLNTDGKVCSLMEKSK